MEYAGITAFGSYVPDRILSNFDLEKLVDTSDEWIVRRTGIRERRMAAPGEFTSDLCEMAVRNMIERSKRSIADVDLIIVCTHTPDFPFPSVSCQLQDRLGIRQTGAIDLNATCAGFVYGLHLASGLVQSGLHRKVLVVAGDSMSKITDYTDRSSCVLFGDGAGAALVEGGFSEPCFLGHKEWTDGEGGHQVYRTGLSSTWKGTPLVDTKRFVQNGQEVYRWAVGSIPGRMRELAEASGFSRPDEIDWFVPHSANLRIIEAICARSGMPLERTLHSMEPFGNTSAASIPLALELALRAGKLQAGQRLMLFGFGGGLLQAGLVLRWTVADSGGPAVTL